MTAVSVVCLILMIMLFAYVAGKFLKTDRKDKLKFLKRKYKKLNLSFLLVKINEFNLN